MSTRISRRLALGAGVTAVALVGVVGLSSSALFTSQDTNSGAFATGSVVLNTSPSHTDVFSIANQAPGSTTSGKVTVTNNGTLGLRYSLSSSTLSTGGSNSAKLGDQLQARVSVLASSGDACTSTAGTEIYAGALSGVLVGNKTAGAQAGDRTLLASTAETLCVWVSLDKTTTGNDFQAAAAASTFTFDAEQTLNNA